MGPLQFTALDLIKLEDTIIACATPSSSAMGLSVLRISGFFPNNQFSSVLTPIGPIGPFSPRVATLTKIYDPKDSSVIDTGIVIFYPAPFSFTGENILEISVHGNPRIVDRLIDVFTSYFSLRVASPGEFTLRAYKNKKLNLSQVEGLDLLLHATTQPLIKVSQHMLEGNLHKEFLDLKNSFDRHQAAIDILTDFSEDIGEKDANKLLISTWYEMKSLIISFYNRCSLPLSHLLKPTIVLFGPPNAGKSTLFNFLLGFKRSIVSDIPGTTRDYVKESIFINASEYFLIDTAGIREAVDDIEDEGIYFTRKNLNDAISSILVFSLENFDPHLFNYFYNLKKPSAIVFTHTKNDYDFNTLPNVTCPVFFVNFPDIIFDKQAFLSIS